MKNIRQEFYMENTVLIEKYMDKIEAELDRCIGMLEVIKSDTELGEVIEGDIEIGEVIEDLQNLRDEIY